MSIDVTDETFQAEVLDRSAQVPVVVDLWATWCGPCRTLGPILEKVVDETEGAVVLAKVETDACPRTAAMFQVQSIPAVYAVRDREVVGGFIGARPEHEVREFVQGLLPSESDEQVAALLAVGDEASLRQALELDPAHEGAIVALAELLVAAGSADEALELLARVPESVATRRVAALARTGGGAGDEEIEARLAELLVTVKGDDDARAQFVDLLDLLGPEHPRTAEWRRRLTAQLY